MGEIETCCSYMMSSFLYLFLLGNVYGQSYCLWGQSNTNSLLNGEYTYNGAFNGADSYVKIEDSSFTTQSTLYLYKTGQSWIVYNETQSSGSIRFYAQCSSSDLSSCTSAGDWGTSASTLYAQEGSCPFWECSTVKTTETGNNGI